MLIISLPIKAFLLLTSIFKFHQWVYFGTALFLLNLGYGQVKMASEKCLEDHNKISKKIEFLSNCEKEDANKKDADSKDEEEHLCFIMRWYCARECTMSAYGQKCDVESLFTLNLEEDDEGYPETLDCVCSYNKYKRGCLSTYQIAWDTVLEEFETNCSIIMRSILFIGGQDEPSRHTMEIFNPGEPEKNKIINISMLQRRTVHVSFLLKNGNVVTAGGYTTRPISDCEIYNPILNTVSRCKNLNSARSSAAVAILDGVPYVCGGADENNRLSSCERYTTGGWKDVKGQMSTDRSAHAMASLGPYIYAIGGLGGRSDKVGSLDSVERYSKSEDKWIPVKSMKRERRDASAAALQGLLYVCGGSVYRSCECYSPEDNSWTAIGKMRHSRFSFNLVATGERLFAFDGQPHSAEVYDPKTNVWTELTEKTIHKRYKSSAVVMP